MDYDTPVYCITLDENNEHRALRCKREFTEKLNLNNFHFVKGVRGKDLTEKEKEEYLSIRSRVELNKGRYVHEAMSGWGCVGCCLSHIKCWKKCIKLDRPVIILEDDAIVNNNGRKMLDLAFKQLENIDYDLIKFHYFYLMDIPGKSKKITENIYEISDSVGADCYLITPKCAMILLDHYYPLDIIVDHYFSFMANLGYIKILAIKPNITGTEGKSVVGHNKLKSYDDNITWMTCYRHLYYILFIILLIIVILFIIYLFRK